MALGDITVSFFLSLVNLMLAGIMLYAWRINTKIPGTGWWSLGVSGLSFGLVLLILFNFYPSRAVLITGFLLQTFGAFSVVYGCAEFAKTRLRIKTGIILISSLFLASIILLLLDIQQAHIIIRSAIFIIIYMRGVLLLSSVRKSGNGGGFAVVFPLFGLALFHLYLMTLAAPLTSRYFHELSIGKIYSGYTVFFAALVMTLVQQGYYKFRENLSDEAGEKEMLFKEMHHRTKNNLALIGSMVALDSMHVKDPEALEILDILQNKIKTIMLLHQQLQDVEVTDRIDAEKYLGMVVDSFTDSRTGGQSMVEIEKRIEPIELEASSAIPIGLVLNELIANCRKHAFKDAPKGIITITLKLEDGRLVVSVSDDGRGLSGPPGKSSLGLSLVRSLTEQLHGEFSLENRGGKSSGTLAVLSFPYEQG